MLYSTEAGQPITTQSMLKAFRMCPREAMYKFYLRLRPKAISKPLERGKWVHALLQTHYEGGDWRSEHKRWSYKFSQLFDEEKERLGDLPHEIARLMDSYFWHYNDPVYAGEADWKVHEVELTVEAEMPNGHLFRGRLDLLVENDYGLWIVDHKTHKRMPDWSMRMLDEQSPLYIWACWEMGIPVRGFIWNYLSTAGISVPRVLKSGTRFYSRDGESDYPTYAAAVKRALAEYPGVFLAKPEDRTAVRGELARLKTQRWMPGGMPTSPHFRRDVIEKTDDLIERVLAAAVRTSDTMHSYDFSDPDCVERNPLSCRGFFCGYSQLSLTDLVTGDSSMVQRREFKYVDDPLDYYDDERSSKK